MARRQTIELAHAHVEVEERTGYVFVVESGQLRSLTELSRYTTAMDQIVAKWEIDRAVIDARAEIGDPPVDVREAMWEWLITPGRGFAMVAFILPSEMAVARVNMTALSRRAPVRAFESVQEAQRWLTRRTGSGSTMSTPAMRAERASSHPPPKQSAAYAPTERPPAGMPATASLPPAPRVPAESMLPERKRPSDRGFRPPTPGGSEQTIRTSTKAVQERPSRESDVRPRADHDGPKKKGSGGSQVA